MNKKKYIAFNSIAANVVRNNFGNSSERTLPSEFSMNSNEKDEQNQKIRPYKKRCIDIIVQIIVSIFKDSTRPILIAVGGPGGSGKSSFCLALHNALSQSSILSLDDYKVPRKQRKKNLYGSHPGANQMNLLVSHLEKLKCGTSILKPVYNPKTGEIDTTVNFVPQDFVILDGEISTYRQFRSINDFSIFIDSDLKTQLATRMNRDVKQLGYSYEKAMSVFLQSNIKDFTRFGAEGKFLADIRLYCKEDYSLEIEAVSEEVFSLCKDILI